MSGSIASQENYQPNLTPILDMVFQLITFFMLVMNVKAASLDLGLKLPVVGSAQPADSNSAGELLVLNIDSAGNLRVYGEEQDVEQYIAKEGEAAKVAAKLENPEFKPGDELPLTVVIRADRATPFHLLNRVVKACQHQGFRKFYYRAMNKEQES